MCYFAYVAVPDPHDGELVRLLSGHGLVAKLLSSEESLRFFGSGYTACEVTDGHCSCGLVEARGDGETKKRARYERRGWSATKIERALRESSRSDPAGAPLLAPFGRAVIELLATSEEVRVLVGWNLRFAAADTRWPEHRARSAELASGAVGLPTEAMLILSLD